MLFKDEAEMQSAFTRFLDGGGWPWIRGSANFELKHVRCRGTRNCRKAGQCMSALSIGPREAGQATALLRASGLGSGTLVYKLPDDSRGKKPFDCSVWRSTPGWFLVGWSCEAVGEVEYWLLEALTMAKWLAAGNHGLRTTDCASLAETTDCACARVCVYACAGARVCVMEGGKGKAVGEARL